MSRSSRTGVAAAAVVAIGVLVGGCGSSSSDLTAKGQKALRPYIQAVRRAAAGTSATELQKKVNALQKEVQHEEQLHHLTTSRGTDIDNAATQLLNDFNQLVVPTATATTSAPTTTPPTTPSSTPPTTPSSTPPTSAPPTSATPTHSHTSSATSTSSPTDSSSTGVLP